MQHCAPDCWHWLLCCLTAAIPSLAVALPAVPAATGRTFMAAHRGLLPALLQ
jgi:hypothetical protein